MPKALLPTSDLHWGFERRIVPAVVREIMTELAISPATPITFNGIDQKAAQQGSRIDDAGNQDNRWPADERIFIEVTEEFEPSRILAMRVHQPDAPVIFEDRVIGVSVRPVLANMKYTVAIKYRARDKNQAMAWRNQMVARLSMGRDLIVHRPIEFHYPLCAVWLELIEHLYGLMKSAGGDAQGDIVKYLEDHFSEQVSLRTDLAGNNSALCVNGKMARIQGYFDFEGQPEKGDRDGDQDAWMVSLNYLFQCDKPIMQVAQWPIAVYNQIVDEKWITTRSPYELSQDALYYGLNNLVMAWYESDRRMDRVRSREGVNLPNYSSFWPEQITPRTVRLMSALCLRDSADPQALLNLAELGDVRLDKDLLAWLRAGEWRYITSRYQSIVQLNLYRGGLLQSKEQIELDENLNVKTTAPMDVRLHHHVRLSLVTDPNVLPIGALERVRRAPAVAQKIIEAIDECIVHLGHRKDIRKNRLTDQEKAILLGEVPIHTGRSPGMNLVRSLVITTEQLKA